jgi:hypothetical protein
MGVGWRDTEVFTWRHGQPRRQGRLPREAGFCWALKAGDEFSREKGRENTKNSEV